MRRLWPSPTASAAMDWTSGSRSTEAPRSAASNRLASNRRETVIIPPNRPRLRAEPSLRRVYARSSRLSMDCGDRLAGIFVDRIYNRALRNVRAVHRRSARRLLPVRPGGLLHGDHDGDDSDDLRPGEPGFAPPDGGVPLPDRGRSGPSRQSQDAPQQVLDPEKCPEPDPDGRRKLSR